MSSVHKMADGTEKEYLSAAETAALLRKALGKSFPETKFYVRSQTYSGGASIHVYYDGTEKLEQDPETYRYVRTYKPGAPTYEAVDAVAGVFAGSRFEGMIDLKYPVTNSLDADGNVTGSASGGSGLPGSSWKTLGPGRLVSFGADFVFVDAELPYDVRTKAVAG